MTLDKHVKKMQISITAIPKKKFTRQMQEKFWNIIRSNSFYDSFGKPDIDHITGESHIAYRFKDKITITASKSGVFTIEDSNFSYKRGKNIQRILRIFLKNIKDAYRKDMNYNLNLTLHTILAGNSLQNFVEKNIKIGASKKFQKVFPDFKGLQGIFFTVSKNIAIGFTAPDDLDFISKELLSTNQQKKLIIISFISKCAGYIESMREKA